MPRWEISVTTEAAVRRAYHLAEGDVLDAQGFIDLSDEDGVFNGIPTADFWYVLDHKICNDAR